MIMTVILYFQLAANILYLIWSLVNVLFKCLYNSELSFITVESVQCRKVFLFKMVLADMTKNRPSF